MLWGALSLASGDAGWRNGGGASGETIGLATGGVGEVTAAGVVTGVGSGDGEALGATGVGGVGVAVDVGDTGRTGRGGVAGEATASDDGTVDLGATGDAGGLGGTASASVSLAVGFGIRRISKICCLPMGGRGGSPGLLPAGVDVEEGGVVPDFTAVWAG